jgi:phosphate transport system substrate-binding protein
VWCREHGVPIKHSLFLGAASLVVVFAGLLGSTSWVLSQAGSERVSLRGAGSTFAAPLYKTWIEAYTASRRPIAITYDPVGSGEGVRRFLADEVDFAGSDEILTDKENAEAGGAIMLPISAGMVVIAYNVPGVSAEIKLPRDVYGDIFAGVISHWDDPRIRAANPGVTFPNTAIQIVAREDGSGTTAALTQHLDAIGPTWRAKGMRVGKLTDWPKTTVLASGNEGVAAKIRAMPGSIGYVEFYYAQRFGLRMAALRNKAGRYITPTLAAGDLALSGRVALVKQLDKSLADPASAGAYPIPSFTWMLLYPAYRDKAKGASLREFAEWVLARQGQDLAARLGYLPLPADVVALGTRELAGLAN